MGAARREIEEAFSLDDAQLDAAAHSLHLAPRLLEHTGMNEMRDFNEYSRSSLLRPAPSTEERDSQEDLLLVTTL